MAPNTRQWFISFPFPLRYLFAAHPQAMGKVLGIIYRAISIHLIHKAGYRLRDGATGALTSGSGTTRQLVRPGVGVGAWSGYRFAADLRNIDPFILYCVKRKLG